MRVSTKGRILAFIADFSSQYGFSPTLREIADGIGHSSVGTVHRHIAELKAEGLIFDAGGKSRSIVLRNDIRTSEKKRSDEQYVCLKTSDGGTLSRNRSIRKIRINVRALVLSPPEGSSLLPSAGQHF